MNKERVLKIGTRGSPLALIQAELVRHALRTAHEGLEIEIIVITTTGDNILDRTLAAIGGKGLFTKEIERALSNGKVDLAVHSAKDIQTDLPPGLMIGAIMKREDARDVLISRNGRTMDELAAGSVIGTASLRRQAQILALRPDLKVVPIRGNVETRLKKLQKGEADATLLAIAGLKRLEKAHVISQIFDIDTMLPAVGQGAIALEIRTNDNVVAALADGLNDEITEKQVVAERALLSELDGSCKTPIAGFAEIKENSEKLYLRAMIAKPDGTVLHRTERLGSVSDAVEIGRDAGKELKRLAGPKFLQ